MNMINGSRDCRVASARNGLMGLASLYDEDFDTPHHAAPPPPAEPSPPEPSPPALSEDDILRARNEGFAEGFAAAHADARASRDQARLAALTTLAAAMSQSGEEVRALIEAGTGAVAGVILSALSAALPSLCARFAEPELRALAASLQPILARQPRAVVRLHPRAIDWVRDEIGRHDRDLARRIAFVAADAMAPSDISVNWTLDAADGGCVRDTSETLETLDAILRPLGLLDRALDPPPRSPTPTAELAHVE